MTTSAKTTSAKATSAKTTSAKTVSALAIAALLSMALFLSPVGISRAQDDSTGTTAEEAPGDAAEEDARPGRGGPALTEEEREARRAEREARRAEFAQAVADELGVTVEALTSAFRTAAIDQVNAAVEAGDLSEERAAAIIERIESADGLVLPGPGGPGGHRGPHGPHGPAAGGAEGEDS